MLIVAGAAGLLAAVPGGCYQRVVGAQGFGADNVGVSQPNVDTGGERILGYKKYTPRRMPGG